MSVFETLYRIDCSEHTEKKTGLTYLSWAWAWAEAKKAFPDSFFTIYENAQGWNYHTDGKTCWVKTGVTVVDGEKAQEYIEYLPVLDFRNSSITLENVTSYDVNKAIQRSLTKALARHGLGLYIYAGDDLPEEKIVKCADCGNVIKPTKKNSAEELVNLTNATYGRPLCGACANRLHKKEEGQ